MKREKSLEQFCAGRCLNFPCLTPLQNKILSLKVFQGLTYKQIAFRVSGNRKGAYSCDVIRGQIYRAKQTIRDFFLVSSEERNEKREICQTLCPEAELYAAQDEVKWTEAPISVYSDGDELRVFDDGKGVNKPLLTSIEKAVLRRLGEGETRAEIAKGLNITRHYVRNICLRLKGKASQLSP